MTLELLFDEDEAKILEVRKRYGWQKIWGAYMGNFGLAGRKNR